jgi:hypothetical protein
MAEGRAKLRTIFDEAAFSHAHELLFLDGIANLTNQQFDGGTKSASRPVCTWPAEIR